MKTKEEAISQFRDRYGSLRYWLHDGEFIDIELSEELGGFISEVWQAASQATANNILGKFIIAGSALTMYQDDDGVLWAAEQLRKSMVEIVEKYEK